MFGQSHPIGAVPTPLAPTSRFERKMLAYTHSRSRLDDESLPHKQPPEAEATDEPDNKALARFVGGPARLPGAGLTAEDIEPLSVFDIVRSSRSRS